MWSDRQTTQIIVEIPCEYEKDVPTFALYLFIKTKAMIVTFKTSESLIPDNLKVVMMGQRDIESDRFVVLYKESEIGHGHFNYSSNTAHVSLEKNNDQILDYLTRAIENRTIKIERQG